MLTDEKLIPIEEARQHVPGTPTLSTVWRWCRERSGVRLEYVMVGRKLYTSAEAVKRFLTALTAEAKAQDEQRDQTLAGAATRSTSDRTDRQRSRDISRAAAVLEAAGI